MGDCWLPSADAHDRHIVFRLHLPKKCSDCAKETKKQANKRMGR